MEGVVAAGRVTTNSDDVLGTSQWQGTNTYNNDDGGMSNPNELYFYPSLSPSSHICEEGRIF